MRIGIFAGLFGATLLVAAPIVATHQGVGEELEDEDLQEVDDSAWTDLMAPTKAQMKRNLEMDKLVQGAWQLVAFESDLLEEYQREERGVVLFGPGFFSMEMHIAYQADDGRYMDHMFQSGTFRYRFNDNGELLARITIGAYYPAPLRSIRFERPGSVRTFEIEVSETRLELRREPGGMRYEFTRLRNGQHDQLDIYGRPILPEDLRPDEFEPPNFEDPVDGEEPKDED